MRPTVDVIAKVQELYMQGRPVPYLTFMHVFNGLLADPMSVEPRKPSEALREEFRAACMAVNVGILDTEGREEQRAREFREKVYPAWKAALPPAEFAKYDEILRGGLRDKRPRLAHEGQLAVQEGADRSRELLKKLGLVEEAPAAPAAEPVELPARMRAPRRFTGVDGLCRAIRGGQLKAQYAPKGQEGEFARYALDGKEVIVKLAEAEGRHYTVLTIGVGRSNVRDAQERIDDLAAGMHYVRMADYAYMRRDEDLVYTLTVGPNVSHMACAATEQGAEDDLVRRIERLHRDLGELVEHMRR
jgi:hypothetical protein